MKKDQPALVILIPGFPKNETDINCLPFAQSLIKSINRNFPFITIIILSFQYPFTSDEYSWENNRVIPFGGKNKGKLARRLLWLKVWRKLKRVQKENNVIGLFSFWLGECALIGNHFGKKYGMPHRCWIAGQDAKANNQFVHKINPNPEELVAISNSVADEFFKNYLIRPRHIIPNGIEKELYQNISFERTIDVMGAGSLITLKQYNLFIDCIYKLKKDISNIYTIIAGKGPEYYCLNNKIKELGLQDNIFLKGEMGHQNLLRLMQQTKIFLHPSSYEGFSMVCLEALYAGCHVISFCKPMNIDFKHWHIVNTENEMCQKAIEILNDPETEYTQVLAYSIEDNAKAIMRLFYQKVLSMN